MVNAELSFGTKIFASTWILLNVDKLKIQAPTQNGKKLKNLQGETVKENGLMNDLDIK
jgi:hypothetical protein